MLPRVPCQSLGSGVITAGVKHRGHERTGSQDVPMVLRLAQEGLVLMPGGFQQRKYPLVLCHWLGLATAPGS